MKISTRGCAFDVSLRGSMNCTDTKERDERMRDNADTSLKCPGTVDRNTNHGKGRRSRGLKVESSEIDENRYVFSGSATRTCRREYTLSAKKRTDTYIHAHLCMQSVRTHAHLHTSSRVPLFLLSRHARKSAHWPVLFLSPNIFLLI